MTASVRCAGCADGVEPPFPFTMAFQPIVDVAARTVWAYEALVRGPSGEPAPQILAKVSAENQYRFDQACRVKAIELAGRLFAGDPEARVSINFMPNAVYEPAACIRTSLAAAARVGLPTHRIVFELSETERVADIGHMRRIVEAYQEMGFVTALDDFGSGFSGLRLLSDFNPGVVKIDMQLLRGVDADPRRRAIVSGVARLARDLGITVVAEGVETPAEAEVLREIGIDLMQGYLFARPALEALPEIAWDGAPPS